MSDYESTTSYFENHFFRVFDHVVLHVILPGGPLGGFFGVEITR